MTACPRLKFDEEFDDVGYRVTAFDPNNTPRGEIDVEFNLDNGVPVSAQIKWISVRSDMQRCGVGTKLYERAARLACADGLKLQSDTVRSSNAEAFWEKQVRKKRAVCLGPHPRRSRDCFQYRLKSCPVRSLRGVKF
jgi:GNAT superfamily N-acetyltransferase